MPLYVFYVALMITALSNQILLGRTPDGRYELRSNMTDRKKPVAIRPLRLLQPTSPLTPSLTLTPSIPAQYSTTPSSSLLSASLSQSSTVCIKCKQSRNQDYYRCEQCRLLCIICSLQARLPCHTFTDENHHHKPPLLTNTYS